MRRKSESLFTLVVDLGSEKRKGQRKREKERIKNNKEGIFN